MKTLDLKTIGGAPSEIMAFDKKQIADAIEADISGRKAPQVRIDSLTQEFVDEFDIKATFHSGSFLGFKVSTDALDAFDEFELY